MFRSPALPGQAGANILIYCFSLQIWNTCFSGPTTAMFTKINAQWNRHSIQNQEAIEFHMANYSAIFKRRHSQEVKRRPGTFDIETPIMSLIKVFAHFLSSPSLLPSDSCFLTSYFILVSVEVLCPRRGLPWSPYLKRHSYPMPRSPTELLSLIFVCLYLGPCLVTSKHPVPRTLDLTQSST